MRATIPAHTRQIDTNSPGMSGIADPGRPIPVTHDDQPWYDVVIIREPVLRLHFRSGTTVYSESLREGRLVGDGWNSAGFLPVDSAPAGDRLRGTGADAFQLEVDGIQLADNWALAGVDTKAIEHGLETTLELSHRLRPVDVGVHTVVDGTAILRRWLTIHHRGDNPAAVATADPWSGVLWERTAHEKLGGAVGTPTFSLGYFADDRWGYEGQFVRTPLPDTGARISGRYGAGPHRHPLFTMQSVSTGETFIGQLAWSGGYRFDLELRGPQEESDRAGSDTRRVVFRAGPEAPAPQRVLQPGETVSTPELHLGCVIGDLDLAINEMHRHVRRSVLPPRDPGRVGLVESGIGPEQEMTEAAVLHEIDAAATLGAEVFFLDASWYSESSSDWYSTVGDWTVADRYPDGLTPFRRRCQELGMRFGLWMEPERLGESSRAMQEHPQVLARRGSGERPTGDRTTGHVNLADDEVCGQVERSIAALITDHQLDFFRLDYNVGPVGDGFVNHIGGLPENHYWRYYQNLYGMFARLRKQFPDVIFENCASGGARTDLGMVPHFDHTWVTDWQLAPRSFWITNGMTMALPPELVDRHVGAGMNDHLRADIDFQCRLALFGRPTVGWLHLRGTEPGPHQVGRVQHMVALYKEFVRPWQAAGRIYHHTVAPGESEPGWGVLEQVSPDRSRGVVGLFRLDGSGSPDYLVRPRGLDVGSRYLVTLDNSGDRFEITGRELVEQGIRVRRDAALTSELIILERVEPG